MIDSLLYIMESLACSGLFLVVYRSFIMQATGFRVSRYFLLIAMIGACTIPLLQIPVWKGQEMYVTIPMWWDASDNLSENALSSYPRWYHQFYRWLPRVYYVGVFVMIVRMLIPLLRAIMLKHKTKLMVRGAYSLVISKDVKNAFSSLRTVYLPVIDNKEEEIMVLAHEESHLRHFHIAERWLMEGLKALCWFNPSVWEAARCLVEVQEMEADSDVLRQGYDLTAYRQILLKHTMGLEEGWVCRFSPSFIKKRMLAMTEHRKIQNMRMWILLPMLGLAILCFGFTIKPLPSASEAEKENGVVVSGRVLDGQTGEPIVGAIIMETGSTKGIITDLKGEFHLETEKDKELKFLMIDYETRTFQVNELGESEEIRLTKTKK